MRTQKELLAHYRAELKRSKQWRASKSTGYDADWKRYINLYEGRYSDSAPSTDRLTVNLVFASINVMVPAVAINYPRFVVYARNPQSAPQAIFAEEVLNALWREFDFQRDFRLSVLDRLLIGHGWVKAGYKWSKPPEVKPAEGDPALAETDEEGIDDREPIPGNTESELISYDMDRPYVERISPFDMFVDPDARHPKEMRWIAQRTWRPIQDVQVDSRYSDSRRKVQGSSYSRWSEEGNQDGRPGDERPDTGTSTFVEVIEFYDCRRNTVSTFAVSGEDEEASGFLIKPAKMPYAMGHPFVMLRGYEVPDNFYTIGDVAQIESLQLELNETRNQMLNYRKRFRRAWLYARDRFDQDGTKALESERDNVMIPVQGDMDPSTAITPVPAIITPPEFFDQSAMISADLDRVSGVSDYQRGAPQANIKRTATEAAMIQDASNARAQDRLAQIEGSLSEIADRLMQLMQQYTTGEQVARVTTAPVTAWVNYTADHLKGDFSFEVQGGSTEPRNETFRRQSAMQIMDVATPFIQQGIVDMPALFAEVLRKGFGIQDAERFIVQPPDPGGPMGPPMPGQPPAEAAAPGVPPQEPQPPAGGAMPMGPQELTPEMFAMMQAGQPPMMPQ
jgi:hypothetical protein